MDQQLALKVLGLVALPTAGAFGGHLWSRFRSRLVTLRWTIQFQATGFATQDQGWGKVDILYNGQATSNLQFAILRLQNTAVRDLQSLTLTAAVDPGTVILRSVGRIQGSLQNFPLSSAFSAIQAEMTSRKLSKEELAYWSARTEFVVPVLNRSGVAELTLLLSRNDHQAPTVFLGCDHPGVRLVHQPFAQETWGVRQPIAAGVGVLVGLLVTALALSLGATGIAVGAIAWCVGAFALQIGAALVRGWRSVLNLAG